MTFPYHEHFFYLHFTQRLRSYSEWRWYFLTKLTRYFSFPLSDILLFLWCRVIMCKMLELESEANPMGAAGSSSDMRPGGEVKPASAGR